MGVVGKMLSTRQLRAHSVCGILGFAMNETPTVHTLPRLLSLACGMRR